MLTLYYSFIHPYLTYCILVWGAANNCYKDSLFKLQKRLRAARILDSAQYYGHTEPIFKKLKILPLVKLHKFIDIIFMFQFRNYMLSEIFNEIFEQNINVHSYHTRQRNKLHLPK